MNKIVVILEDEETVANVLDMLAKRYGFDSKKYCCVEDLINDIHVLNNATLFITDFNLNDSTVIPVLKEIKTRNLNVYTMLNSGNPNAVKDIENAGLLEFIHEISDKTINFRSLFERFA